MLERSALSFPYGDDQTFLQRPEIKNEPKLCLFTPLMGLKSHEVLFRRKIDQGQIENLAE